MCLGEGSNSLNINNPFNINSFNGVYNVNFGGADERVEILAWLSPVDPGCGTRILESTESSMWETSFYDQRNIRIGAMEFTVANTIIRPYFDTEIRGLGRPTLGKKPYPR